MATTVHALLQSLSLLEDVSVRQQPDNGGPDVLYLALITAASIGTAALLGLLFHFIRVGIGFDPHRPPERPEEPDEHPSEPEH